MMTMKLNKICLFAFALSSFALAQEPVAPAATEEAQVSESTEQETTPATESVVAEQPQPTEVAKDVEPQPAEKVEPEETKAVAEQASEPAKPESANPFAVLHGNAYNGVANEAAADNVDGLLARPDKFYGKKFFYIEPSGETGVASLGSFFAAMDLSGDLGRATLGYASNGFGVALRASLGRFAVDGDNGKKSGTEGGDDLGMVVSKVIAGYALALNADWLTNQDETNTQPKVGKPVEESYNDLKVALSLSNGPSAKQNFWTAGVGFYRSTYERKIAGIVKDENSYSDFVVKPFFNFGTVALQKERARLLLGLNTSVPFRIPEELEVERENGDTVKTSTFGAGVVFVPNIMAEVSVLESLMLFGEADYYWNVFEYTSGTDPDDDEYTGFKTRSDEVSAKVGLRYQYQDLLACEFSFGDRFFTDTKSIFNGEGVFVSFGGFVFF